ncbi:MAG: STAS/SEC14 domain-containing protein [bacterium]|nr:STAS/SEC14 domain-containing protein [bacterium]
METKVNFKGGVVFLTLCDFTDETEAEEVIYCVENIFAKAKPPIAALVFLDCYRGSTTKTRFLVGEFLKNKMDQVSKIAFVGSKNKPFEIATMVVMALSGFHNFKFFTSEKSALAWVKVPAAELVR